MGGNTRAIDRKSGKTIAFADRIDFNVISRLALTVELKQFFVSLNQKFRAFAGDVLCDESWFEDEPGVFCSGSASHLFDSYIDDAEFYRHKPSMGDIDVMVPREKLDMLFDFLASCEGERLHRSVTYVGQNKRYRSGHQINALFRYEHFRSTINIQVDFEGVAFEKHGGFPTAFSRLGHSSSWSDVLVGLKGVAHKFLLTNLVRARSVISDAVIITEKSPLPPDPVRLSHRGGDAVLRTHAFSVDRGLRRKLVPIMIGDFDRIQLNIDGKNVFRELPTAESEYVTNIEEIADFIFGDEPRRINSLHVPFMGVSDSMWSFVDLLNMCSEWLDKPMIQRTFSFMVQENLYGKNAQRLSRHGPKEDIEIKSKITSMMYDRFTFLCDEKQRVDEMAKRYYSSYTIGERKC